MPIFSGLLLLIVLIITIFCCYNCYKKKILLFKERGYGQTQSPSRDFSDIATVSPSTSTSSDSPPNYDDLYYKMKERSNESEYQDPEPEPLPKYNE